MEIQTNEDAGKLWVFIGEIVLMFKLEGSLFQLFSWKRKIAILVNYKCKFVVRYLQNKNFTLIKCDIPNESLQKVINYKKQLILK